MFPLLKKRSGDKKKPRVGHTVKAASSSRECTPARQMNDKCPGCGSSYIITGRYLDQIAGGLLPVFRPSGLKRFTLTGSDVRIPAADRFCCCVECGHLWSGLKPEQLLRVLQRYGNKATRARFGEEGRHFLGDF